jgi:hypothetical protein
MATLNTKLVSFADLGAAVKRLPETNHAITLTGSQVHDVTDTITDAASPAYSTLWDSSSAVISTFSGGFLICDPNEIRSDHQDVDVRITINGSTHIERRDRNLPMIFGASAQGTGAITKIEVANVAVTATGAGNVDVRLVLFL